MVYKRILVVIILSMTIALFSLSNNDAYVNIKNAYSNLEQFQADITQLNTFESENIEIESKGIFYYTKERIAIKYSEPQKQEIYMNGNQVLFFDADSNTCVEMMNNDSQVHLNPVYMIDNYWKYSDKKIKKLKGNYVIILRPLQEKEFIQIDVHVNKKTFLIERLVYIDIGNNVVDIKFQNINTVDKIKADVWKLNLPEDVNYIKR